MSSVGRFWCPYRAITSEGPAADAPGERSESGPADATSTDVEELLADLTDLAGSGQSAALADEIRTTTNLLAAAHDRGLIDSGVRRFQVSDAAEAFVGSVIFASPLLVEDGVFEIGEYLFSYTVAGIPAFLIANTLFVFLVTYALLEWTGRNTTDSHLITDRLPARVVMILVVSFLVAAVLMTVWGRVGDWESPIVAIARINVLWTVGSLGAALGDILPGESSGDDINDDLAEVGEVIRELDDVVGREG